MVLLAVVSTAAGVFELSERHQLLRYGVETAGVVIGVDVGVKGLRSVEARFETRDGLMIVGRDIHKTQWISANEVGDRIFLHYDPKEPERILIERGFWIWSNPAFLLAAGVGLFALGVFIYKQSAATRIAS